MKFFAFVDLHGNRMVLEQAMLNAINNECKFIICAGDLTNFGAGLSEMMSALSKSKIPVFIIPGNHETNEEIDKECKKYKFVNLHAQAVSYRGLTLAGIGGSNITPFNTPNEHTEDEIKEVLEKFKGRENLLLVSHAPPYGYLDEVGYGQHAGSKALLEFIKAEQPLMVICGHIHEHAGKETIIGNTKVINPGKGSIISLQNFLKNLQ